MKIWNMDENDSTCGDGTETLLTSSILIAKNA